MSKKYRLMIYFAHSTLVFYEKDIYYNKIMTVSEFREANKFEVKRVFDEALSLFNYELSYEQMNRAIQVYLMAKYKPGSVQDTEIYTLEKHSPKQN